MSPRLTRRLFLMSTVAIAAIGAGAGDAIAATTSDSLAQDFVDPPASARPRVWWHWMNGQITRDGIDKDLRWMKRAGIGGVQNFDIGDEGNYDPALATPQVVERRLVYMSPEWKDTFRFAVERAAALDLEFAIAAAPGWSQTGGPWVPPQDAMKKLVWSDTVLSGEARLDAVLPAPPAVAGPFQTIAAAGTFTGNREFPAFYTDALVLAYPIRPSAPALRPAITVNGKAVNGTRLWDKDFKTSVDVPTPGPQSPSIVQCDFASEETVASATIFVSGRPTYAGLGNMPVVLEASTDGRNWRKLAEGNLAYAPATFSFAPISARAFRLSFLQPAASEFSFAMAPGADLRAFMKALTPKPSIPLVQFELSAEPRVHAFETKAGFSISRDYGVLDRDVGPDLTGVVPEAVVDVTAHMDADGRFSWVPPSAGTWKIVRLGYSLTGTTNHPATSEATGLEVDKYDAKAVETYLNTYLDMYRDAVGSEHIGARGINALLNDSTEIGASNWTPRILEQFERLRGYDPKPYLLALTGVIVGSRSKSDAFLYDYRRTLSELHASQHYGTVAKVAHERGLKVYSEALEGTSDTLGDDLDMRSYADIPMAAFWTYTGAPRAGALADVRGAASIAHLNGHSLVACETLTSVGQPWAHAPRDLQPMIDMIFANGVTRPVIHASVHQPVDRAPGMSLRVFGQFFTRLESWAEMAKPWTDYMARNSLLLQQGRNVADIAYFYGEDMPVGAQGGEGWLKDAPKSHAYDFVSAEALKAMEVREGDLQSRGGARYKAIYLNRGARRMTLPVLRKLAALAEAGATIIGEAPLTSPGLNDDAREYAAITERLWGGGATTRVGSGRVIAGRNVEGALAKLGVEPDFAYDGDASILFVHRRLDDGGDLYFITNRTDSTIRTEGRFRVTGRSAELWHADSGKIEATSYRSDARHTIVPLTLRPYQSVFVVFRKLTSVASAVVAAPEYRQIATIEGPWNVAFQSGRGAPADAVLPALASLSDHPEPGIRYFSGVATYTKAFDLPPARSRRPQFIDLGAIGDIAEVRINGHLAGTAWKAPYRVEIGQFARPGRNVIEIRVANLWVNRLIGDQQPNAERITFTAIPTYLAEAPLRPSGLLGPVTLWTEGPT